MLMCEVVWRDTVGEARADVRGWLCWRCHGTSWASVRLARTLHGLDGWRWRDAHYTCAHCGVEGEFGLLLGRPSDGRWAWCHWLDAEVQGCSVSSLSMLRAVRRSLLSLRGVQND